MAELRSAEEMRDSGIEWIGKIPNNWIIPKILYVLRGKITDGPHETPDYIDEGIPFISIDSLNETKEIDFSVCKRFISEEEYNRFATKTVLEEGDILFSKAASIGKTAIVGKEKFMVWSPLAILKNDSSKVANGYLYYLLNCSELITAIALSGSMNTQINVGMRELEQARIPLPMSLLEQQAIADYLDDCCSQIDEIIAEATASIEEYKELKQAVIFEAVTHGIHCSTRKYSGFSWIGDIPTHWKTAQLKRFASIQSGITLGKKYDNTCELIEVPYLRVANVQSEYIDLSEVALIKVLPGELEKYRLHSGELLMTEGGDRDKLGRGCIWNGEIDPCIHQNHVFALSVTKPDLFVEYLDFVTTSDVGRNYFDLTAKKTTNLASTNSTTIMSFHIPVPPLNEQKEIVEYLNRRKGQIDSLISEKQSLIDDLQAYKKSLIYEVVTGKRRAV